MQVSIPDELPAEAGGVAGLLSMTAGDFVEVYGAPEQAGQFDSVATCFFIDTAHNIIRYMEVIRHCLKVCVCQRRLSSSPRSQTSSSRGKPSVDARGLHVKRRSLADCLQKSSLTVISSRPCSRGAINQGQSEEDPLSNS